MNRLTLVLSFVLILVSSGLAVPEGIPIQYMDSKGRMPMSTADRIAITGERGSYLRTIAAQTCGTDAEKVVLLVEEGINSDISASLATFQADLEAEGYVVDIWLISGGTVVDIRNDLKIEYASGDLVGAICIGDIPTGWMDGSEGEYPVDVFLMDMNGTWNDPDSDGLYESASNEGPEIWIGRLTPTYMTYGGAAEMLNDYFARNHAYRTGTLSLPDRALAYEEAFAGLTQYLDLLYTTVVTKNNPEANADDFKAELINGYQWVHLICHSSPWGSSFHDEAPPDGDGTFNNFEVLPLDPHAFFYVLNCCSNGRWTEVDNIANSYIWTDSYGLAVLAQTKLDYTNYFYEYYHSLASGNCLGEAYRAWLAQNMYYAHGAVLLGDPTLVPRMPSICLGSTHEEKTSYGSDNWLTYSLTEGLHSQGRVDTYSDPSSGEVFAVSGSSYPVRANVLATHSDGDTWTEPVLVYQQTYWDWHPTVGGDGTGNVWTAWQSMHNNWNGYDIHISKWTGSAWGSINILTSGDPFEVEPAMDGGNGYAWLVWQKWQNASTDIEGIIWTGSSWSSIFTLSSEEGDERYPDVAYGGVGFGLVYHARRDGNWVIGFRDAPDSGTFSSETVISSVDENSRYACITSDGANYWVTWQNDAGAILCSNQSGGTWSTPEIVSSSSGCVRPSITSNTTGEVTVMWTADGNKLQCNTNSGGSWEGYYTAVSADAIDDASLAWAGDKLWAVYGKRDTDLQWDLWACTPDPEGIAGSSSPDIGQFDISVVGRNPFSSSTVLQVSAPTNSRLRIYDLSGRTVMDTEVESGLFTWNGMSDNGSPVPSGVYFAVISDPNRAESCKLIKI